MFDKIDQLGVNTIRTLSIEAVQKANSGHPGLPMGAAPMAYALWTKHLKVNPTTSKNWADRDRFVLSAGHGSAMLYSLLHLAGYQVTIDDLKQFRQWDSKTPGHPEVHHTDGVEATTGPLGQGIAMAVGMAMAEAHLAATYNKENFNVMDHYTYAICGDGNDLEAISKAIEEAKAETDKPTLIEVKTVIGYGAPKEGTSAVHGAPLGEDGIKMAKEVYGWEYPDFTVPEEVAARFHQTMIEEGQKAEDAWNEMFANYKKAYPELAQQFEDAFDGKLPENWDAELPTYEVGSSQASRVSSKEVIQELSKAIPSFWGGSADLSGSNNTMVAADKDFTPEHYEGRNIWFGVREFAMASAMNGIQLHGGTRIYGGTFFVFVDYLRPAVRLAAIQHTPVVYVLTHDSVAVGEDGPTHEPIEQLASVRCMPGVQVIRPADGNETRAAWKVAMETTDAPTILVLSRQNLPVLPSTKEVADEMVKKGAYVLSPSQGETPEGILIATGSEVDLAVKAQKELAEKGKDVSVVSMPSFDLFEKQSSEYKESVLPKSVKKRVAIEAAASFGWERYVGTEGATITIDHFGASAPGTKILEEFGFTVENVVNTYNQLS